MVNFKKLDEVDLFVVNRKPTEEENKAFSEFLKKKREQKEKLRLKQAQINIKEEKYSNVS